MIGDAFKVLVRHATTGEWMLSDHWLCQSEASANKWADEYRRLGLEARVDKYQVDYAEEG